MDTKTLLMEFSRQTGVAGREGGVAAWAAKQLEAYGTVESTPLGSLLCTVQAPQPGGPHLLLDAHMDEIGMVVTFVDDTGYLRVGACGGVDRRILAASPVTVHTEDGPLTGVVCSTPPHLSSGEKKNGKVEDIYIDIGYGGEEAKKRVNPGDVVTLSGEPRELMNGLVSGKALDDRAGCAVHLKALEYLKGAAYTCGLTVLFSSMEEVGGQGAKTAAYRVDPTHAIAVDVSFAYTPDSKRENCGDLKKGPMIGFAPILNKDMSRGLVEVAKNSDIPFQREVMGGKTGTNADPIATTRGGVVTGLISVPQKYMHTPIETVAVCDVENCGKLIAEYIKATWGVK